MSQLKLKMYIKLLLLLLLPSLSIAQTKIGWTQLHIEGTDDYYVEYCDDIKCYAEFGFQSPFFKNAQQFYFFKKDSYDNAKLFFIAKDIQYVESFNDWHLYYMQGISMTKLSATAENTQYTMMLQKYNLQQWKNDSIPTLIQIYPITNKNVYPIYTFEPTQQKFKSLADTIHTTYMVTQQRVVAAFGKQNLKDIEFIELNDSSKFELTFFNDMLQVQQQQNIEHWILNAEYKIFQNGEWKYTLRSSDFTDSTTLILLFPIHKNWQHATTGTLQSVKIWSNKIGIENVLTEVIIEANRQ